MTSSITWIGHDPATRDRMLRILLNVLIRSGFDRNAVVLFRFRELCLC